MFFKKDKSRVVDKNPDELPGGKEKIISQGVFSLKIDIRFGCKWKNNACKKNFKEIWYSVL